MEKYRRRLNSKLCIVMLVAAWVGMVLSLERTCDCMMHNRFAHMLVAAIVCLMFRVGYLLTVPRY